MRGGLALSAPFPYPSSPPPPPGRQEKVGSHKGGYGEGLVMQG